MMSFRSRFSGPAQPLALDAVQGHWEAVGPAAQCSQIRCTFFVHFLFMDWKPQAKTSCIDPS